jgi:urease accessory protein
MSSLATLLQLCDSAFPSGAFSHSFGLETAIAEDAVLDAASLEAWVRRYLLSGLASLDGSAIALVVRDGAVAETLDNVLGAALFCAEHRAAARRLALAMLDAYAAMAIPGCDDTRPRSQRDRRKGTPPSPSRSRHAPPTS